MAFCKNCGNNLPEGATFCSQCGTPVANTGAQATTETKQDGTKGNGVFDMPDTTAEFDPTDIRGNKGMAVLAYIGLLVLIPIFAAKNSKFAKFHSSQGLNLCLFSIAYSIVYGIVWSIITAVCYSTYALWALGGILTTVLGIINTIVSLAILALMILGIVNACQGKAKKLPVIGKFDILGKFMK